MINVECTYVPFKQEAKEPAVEEVEVAPAP